MGEPPDARNKKEQRTQSFITIEMILSGGMVVVAVAVVVVCMCHVCGRVREGAEGGGAEIFTVG